MVCCPVVLPKPRKISSLSLGTFEERIQYRIQNPRTLEEKEMYLEMLAEDPLNGKIMFMHGLVWEAVATGLSLNGGPFVWTKLCTLS